MRPHKTTLRPGIDARALNPLADEFEEEAAAGKMRSAPVIMLDVNVLLYAEIDAHRLHALTRRWWEEAPQAPSGGSQ